ncbi:hypothetical protein [Streptomyces niveus]|uniref:Zeta toxin domain-containing protein n=1 Tax=Streptomyces niveus TaxID=193462 RepID=A0ABZ2AHR5_STRNV|nr:hypothetical protein [Streptomyces niveus]
MRDRFGRNLALVGQDNLRRIVLRERDRPGAANIGLIGMTARYALDAGFHTVVEGILYADRMPRCWKTSFASTGAISHCYHPDVPLQETLLRHATKRDLAYLAQVTDQHLRDWYRERDLLPSGVETIVEASSTLDNTVKRIMRETGPEHGTAHRPLRPPGHQCPATPKPPESRGFQEPGSTDGGGQLSPDPFAPEPPVRRRRAAIRVLPPAATSSPVPPRSHTVASAPVWARDPTGALGIARHEIPPATR